MLSQKWPRQRNDYFYYFFLFSIFLLAVVVRLKYLFAERMGQDEALYAWYAKRIFESPTAIFSKELLQYHPPLFSLLLLLGQGVHPPELGYRAVVVLINVMGIVVLWMLGKKIGGEFLGVFSVLCLAFNINYIFFANLIGPDVALTVFLTGFVFLLTYHDGTWNVRRDCLVGILSTACIGVKWSGLIVIPIFILWLSFACSDVAYPQRLKLAVIPLSFWIIAVAGLCVINCLQSGQLLSPATLTTFFNGAYFREPFWYYVKELPIILSLPILLPFLLYGLWLCISSNRKDDRLLAIWLGVCFIGISLSHEKLLRYSLLILPSSLLIAGRGIQTIINRILSKSRMPGEIYYGYFMILTIFSCGIIFSRFETDIQQFAQTHTGFAEAGQWIKELGSADTVIYASSLRQIQYYSTVGAIDQRYQFHFPPAGRDDFIKEIKKSTGNVILVIDRWERLQPAWLNLDYDDNIRQLEDSGFRFFKVVRRVYNGKTRDVIWLFSREKSGIATEGQLNE